MLDVLILGAGGHAQVVADILLQAHRAGAPANPMGYLDDNSAIHGHDPLSLPILGRINDLPHVPHDAVIIAIGDNRTRRCLVEQCRLRGEHFVTARHPSAVVAPDVRLEAGVMICAGVVVNPGSVIGASVILNTGCTVDHHNHIGDYAHIAPGVHLGGDVEIGEGALIGIGATVLSQHRVGAWSVVGAGAVVTKDVPPHTTVIGVPARVIKLTNVAQPCQNYAVVLKIR